MQNAVRHRHGPVGYDALVPLGDSPAMATRMCPVVVSYVLAARLGVDDLPRRHGRGRARWQCPPPPSSPPTNGVSLPARRVTVVLKRTYWGLSPPPAAAAALVRTAPRHRWVLSAKRQAAPLPTAASSSIP